MARLDEPAHVDVEALTTPSLPKRNFTALWVGQGMNALGLQIRILAFPLLAVQTLDAGTFEIGVLNAAAMVAYLIVGLPAGPLVDRLPKKQVLVITNLASALAVVTVVISWRAGVLGLPQLYLVALILGIGGVISGVAYLSIIPEAVPKSQLVPLTGRVTVVQTLAQVSGPAAAGVLIGVMGPIDILGLTVVCLVAAAGCVWLVRVGAPVTKEETAPRVPVHRLIGEGLRYVADHPMIRRITLASAASAGFGAVWQAAVVVFLVRSLGASDATVGLVFAIAAIGGVLGGIVAPRIINRWGRGPTLRWWLPVSSLFGFLMVVAASGWSVFLVAAADFFMMFGAIVFNVAQTSARLEVCPKPLLGRMNATIRTAVWSAGAFGALAGAGLGLVLAPRWVILVGVAATAVSTWWVCAGSWFAGALSQPGRDGAHEHASRA